MKTRIDLDAIYSPSEDLVARQIEGELILVPLTSGVGDMEDELYSLNGTGKEIWNLMDGEITLRGIVEKLSETFDSEREEIEVDVKGFAEALLDRRIIRKRDHA